MKNVLLSISLTVFILLSSGCSSETPTIFSGTIEGREIPITAPIAGELIALDREEGEVINPQDRLAKMDDEALRWQLKEAEAILAGAEATWAEIKAGTRAQQVQQAMAAVEQVEAASAQAASRIDQARAQLAQAEVQVLSVKSQWDGAKNSLTYQEKQLKSIDRLYAQQAIAARELDLQQELVNQALTKEKQLQAQYETALAQLKGGQAEYDAAQAQLEIVAAQKKSALAQLSLLQEGATAFTLQHALAVKDQAQAKVEQAKILLHKTDIFSPASGIILRKHGELGQQVLPGSLLYTVLVPENLEVTVYVPEADLHLVQLGQKVLVKVATYPREAFAGKITRINSKAEFTPKNVQTAKERSSMVFGVTVTLTEGWEQLKPGMTADVILNTTGEKERH